MPQMDLYANQVVPGGVFKLALVGATFLWLKGPFVWTFIKVLTRRETGFRNNALHFLPWLCVLVTTLIFPQYAMTCIFMGMAHMTLYLICALWRLIKMRAYLVDVWHGFQNSAYYWLLYVIGGAMTLVTVDLIVMSLVTSGVMHTYNLLDYCAFPAFSIYVLSIGFLSVYRPELLFREPSEEARTDTVIAETMAAVNVDHKEQSEQKEQVDQKEQLDQKERHLELDLGLAQTLAQQLTRLMQEQHIYRQNELSLPDLAGHLGISVHQVSELLNVHSGISFYDFINGYRLKYACSLLADPDCHLRILDIAFEAGYNSKNSFYRVFKESLGVTPNQYRNNALAAKPVTSSQAMET
ncbi:helix-turn-helix domain-containing protein [Cellvibrio zantedeschiae]|nr:helix-turn-helix domain-containing protein [Cellvibrio zantedeschiae]